MTLPPLWLIVAASCLPVFTATQHQPRSPLFLFPLVTHSGLQVSSSLLFAQYHTWLLTLDSRVIQSPYSVVIPLPQAFCAYQLEAEE